MDNEQPRTMSELSAELMRYESTLNDCAQLLQRIAEQGIEIDQDFNLNTVKEVRIKSEELTKLLIKSVVTLWRTEEMMCERFGIN